MRHLPLPLPPRLPQQRPPRLTRQQRRRARQDQIPPQVLARIEALMVIQVPHRLPM